MVALWHCDLRRSARLSVQRAAQLSALSVRRHGVGETLMMRLEPPITSDRFIVAALLTAALAGMLTVIGIGQGYPLEERQQLSRSIALAASIACFTLGNRITLARFWAVHCPQTSRRDPENG